MAEFSAAHPLGLARRRLYRRGSGEIVDENGHYPLGDTTTTDHQHNLRQSQMGLSPRKRGAAGGVGSSMMLGSVRHISALGGAGGGGVSASSIFKSGIGLGMAQTAVLGDSQGSATIHGSKDGTTGVVDLQSSTIPEEDLVADGGVGSTLGESYVDGRRPAAGVGSGIGINQSQREEDEELEDGGVLGLLAQIYGTGGNLKGRGRGPPRAI